MNNNESSDAHPLTRNVITFPGPKNPGVIRPTARVSSNLSDYRRSKPLVKAEPCHEAGKLLETDIVNAALANGGCTSGERLSQDEAYTLLLPRPEPENDP